MKNFNTSCKSIVQSTELLENCLKDYQEEPNLYRAKCKELILNITEFIDTYNILKKIKSKKGEQNQVNIKRRNYMLKGKNYF